MKVEMEIENRLNSVCKHMSLEPKKHNHTNIGAGYGGGGGGGGGGGYISPP